MRDVYLRTKDRYKIAYAPPAVRRASPVAVVICTVCFALIGALIGMQRWPLF